MANLKIYLKDLIYILSLITVGLLVMQNLNVILPYLRDETKLQALVSSFGTYGPFTIVLLHIIYNIGGFMLLPGPTITIMSVFMYGPFTSFLLNLVGSTIGTTLFFFIIRGLGAQKARAVIQKLSAHLDLEHFERFFRSKEKAALLISRMIPIFPSEIVTVFCAIEGMDAEEYILINFIAHIPRLLLENYFFAEMKHGFASPLGKIMLIVSVLFVLIYVFRHPVKKMFNITS